MLHPIPELPLAKESSTPRLELLAALVLARLIEHVKEALQLDWQIKTLLARLIPK